MVTRFDQELDDFRAAVLDFWHETLNNNNNQMPVPQLPSIQGVYNPEMLDPTQLISLAQGGTIAGNGYSDGGTIAGNGYSAGGTIAGNGYSDGGTTTGNGIQSDAVMNNNGMASLSTLGMPNSQGY